MRPVVQQYEHNLLQWEESVSTCLQNIYLNRLRLKVTSIEPAAAVVQSVRGTPRFLKVGGSNPSPDRPKLLKQVVSEQAPLQNAQ